MASSVASALPAVQLQKSAPGANAVEYNLVNNTVPANPCDILGLVVSGPGDRSITAADWVLPMGGAGSGLESWQQLTGKAFTDVFAPIDPCVGYFLNFTGTTVPEPASLAMLALGCVGILGRRRRAERL